MSKNKVLKSHPKKVIMLNDYVVCLANIHCFATSCEIVSYKFGEFINHGPVTCLWCRVSMWVWFLSMTEL